MSNRGESNQEEEVELASAAAEAVEEEEDGGLGPCEDKKVAAAEGGVEEEAFDDEVFDKREPKKKKKKKKKNKVKQLFLLPIQQFEKLYIENKRRKKGRSSRPPPVPFPYAYDDPAVAKGCYFFCFAPPPIPNDLPHLEANPMATTKPSPSSYRVFLTSLLEKNDFYSKECNVHRDVRPPKQPEDKD